MFTTEVIRPSPDILDEIKRLARDLPRVFPRALETELRGVRRGLLAALQEEPGRPKYPIRWASEKQRRFVMALLRRQGNLPYKRTGRFVRAWKVELVGKGFDGELIATNDSGIEQFITGVRQQPFHKDTGWYQSEDVIDAHRKKADDVLIDVWFAVTEFQIGQ